jgi:hypothetical protein
VALRTLTLPPVPMHLIVVTPNLLRHFFFSPGEEIWYGFSGRRSHHFRGAHRDVHKGIAALCLGGGNAVAMAIER